MTDNIIDLVLFLGVFIAYVSIVAVAVLGLTAHKHTKDKENDLF